MTVDKDGRPWRIGTANDVAWIAGHTIDGLTVTNAIPPRFDAYATFYQPEDADITLHERAVVNISKAHTAEQPWWLGYLDTGAHDVVFNTVPKVTLYWGWRYVLVEAGPEQALTWRTGHMRSGPLGGLPDLFFPADRTWIASALWDDTWTDFGGSAELVDALQRDPIPSTRHPRGDTPGSPAGWNCVAGSPHPLRRHSHCPMRPGVSAGLVAGPVIASLFISPALTRCCEG